MPSSGSESSSRWPPSHPRSQMPAAARSFRLGCQPHRRGRNRRIQGDIRPLGRQVMRSLSTGARDGVSPPRNQRVSYLLMRSQLGLADLPVEPVKTNERWSPVLPRRNEERFPQGVWRRDAAGWGWVRQFGRSGRRGRLGEPDPRHSQHSCHLADLASVIQIQSRAFAPRHPTNDLNRSTVWLW